MNQHGPSAPDRRDSFVSFQKRKFFQEWKNKDEKHDNTEDENVVLSSTLRGISVYFQGFLDTHSDYHLKKLVTKHGGKVMLVQTHICLF